VIFIIHHSIYPGLCEYPRKGPLCAVCSSGYYPSTVDGACNACAFDWFMLVAMLLGVSVGVGMCVYYVRRTLHRATHVIETHTHGDGPRARIHTTTHTPTSKSARSVLFKILWSGLQVNAVALTFAFRFEDFFEYYLMLQQAVMSVYVSRNVWKYTCVALYMCVRGIYIIHEYTRSHMHTHTFIYIHIHTYTGVQCGSVSTATPVHLRLIIPCLC
jgi:hypothetical protein